MKRLFAFIAALAVMAGIGLAGSPASASVPDWDLKSGVHSAAEWAAIATAPDAQDLAFAQNLPASLTTLAKRTADECPSRPPTGSSETFCLWNGYNFTGTVWKIPRAWLGDTNGSNPYNGLSFSGSGINNASKSWYNQTYYTVRLFDNESCIGIGWYRDLAGSDWALSYDANTNDWENRMGSIAIVQYSGNTCSNVPGQ